MVSMLRTELTVSLEDAGTNGICQKNIVIICFQNSSQDFSWENGYHGPEKQ